MNITQHVGKEHLVLSTTIQSYVVSEKRKAPAVSCLKLSYLLLVFCTCVYANEALGFLRRAFAATQLIKSLLNHITESLCGK